jgi:hypothetical protein
MLFAVLMTIGAAYVGYEYWLLINDGAVAVAKDVKLEKRVGVPTLPGVPSRDTRIVHFNFTDGSGRVHAVRRVIGRELYDELSREPSKVLRVRYSRKRPKTSVLDTGRVSYAAPIIVAGLAAATWLVVLVRT